MPLNPLFSTYRAGENRVTSSLIAVFERIDIHLVERIVAAALAETTVTMLTFTNQVTKDGHGAHTVPDAAISANFRWLFEVKTVRGALTKKQLAGHLVHLDGSYADERLVAVTPDVLQPQAIEALNDPRVAWTNFAAISDAIDTVLSDPTEISGERTEFLLRELQSLFRADGLLDFDDVVVVAARTAYPEYLQDGAYICQSGRSFQAGISHMGFYADGEIKRQVASILSIHDQVTFSSENADRLESLDTAADLRIADLIRSALSRRTRIPGQQYKVFLLSEANDTRTVQLQNDVKNSTLSSAGKPAAWTQSQRYTRISALQLNPPTTGALASQLIAPGDHPSPQSQ
ncbi:MAG: hypothetical protein IPO93_16145 [Actinobacteria bacterium]|jgi:hypothetical protein|nr:hypothetical protein [Actinomycetota bacterium]